MFVLLDETKRILFSVVTPSLKTGETHSLSLSPVPGSGASVVSAFPPPTGSDGGSRGCRFLHNRERRRRLKIEIHTIESASRLDETLVCRAIKI